LLKPRETHSQGQCTEKLSFSMLHIKQKCTRPLKYKILNFYRTFY